MTSSAVARVSLWWGDTLAAVADTVGGAEGASGELPPEFVDRLLSSEFFYFAVGAIAALVAVAAVRSTRRAASRRRAAEPPVPETAVVPRSYRVRIPGGSLSIGNAQAQGSRREQQDSFGCSDTAPEVVGTRGVVAVVADGMGGLELGGEASKVAVRAFLRTFEASEPREALSSTLLRALEAANEAVLELADEADARGAVGTTLVAACVRDGALHWIGVGDSRLYLLRGGELRLLTVDHSYARTLERRVAAGVLTPEQAAQHPDRNALISYLGQDRPAEVSTNAALEPLRPGDRLLLCSDGVHGVLGADRIAEALRQDAQAAANALVAAVLAERRPRQDNLTAVVLAYDTERS